MSAHMIAMDCFSRLRVAGEDASEGEDVRVNAGDERDVEAMGVEVGEGGECDSDGGGSNGSLEDIDAPPMDPVENGAPPLTAPSGDRDADASAGAAGVLSRGKGGGASLAAVAAADRAVVVLDDEGEGG